MTAVPLLYQPLAGLMAPFAPALVVRKYCVVRFAVKVALDAGAITVWDAAPLSDQLWNRYCVPAAPACGEETAIVWLDPGVHWSEQGEVQADPSALSANPAGAVDRVTATAGAAEIFGLDAPIVAVVDAVSVAVELSATIGVPLTPPAMVASVVSVTIAIATAAPMPNEVPETPAPDGRAVTVLMTFDVAVTVSALAVTEPKTPAVVLWFRMSSPNDPATETFPPEAPAVAAAEVVLCGSVPAV